MPSPYGGLLTLAGRMHTTQSIHQAFCAHVGIDANGARAKVERLTATCELDLPTYVSKIKGAKSTAQWRAKCHTLGLPQDVIDSLNEGTQGQSLGFRPDIIEEFEMGSQMADAPTVQVMDTNSPSFNAYLEALAASRDNGRLPDICSIDVPVRVLD